MHPVRSQINTTKLRDAWDLLEAPHLLCAVQGVDNCVHVLLMTAASAALSKSVCTARLRPGSPEQKYSLIWRGEGRGEISLALVNVPVEEGRGASLWVAVSGGALQALCVRAQEEVKGAVSPVLVLCTGVMLSSLAWKEAMIAATNVFLIQPLVSSCLTVTPRGASSAVSSEKWKVLGIYSVNSEISGVISSACFHSRLCGTNSCSRDGNGNKDRS